MSFLCVCFPRKFLDLWICWRLDWLLCLWVYLWFGLFSWIIFCFFGFDGDWIWLLDLDLGFVRDWFGFWVYLLDLGRT